MHTHKPNEPEHVDTSHGYERSDVRVNGIVVFLTALSILVAVSWVLCYGIGKVINVVLNHEDGPTSKWAKVADVRDLGNLANNPEMQSKVAQLTQQFPGPRLQNDSGDGAQDLAALHDREDLLLDHYSKIDGSDKIRIPIDRAMEIIAQRGLPTAPAEVKTPLLTGETAPAVTAPLTNGFTRTAYEQDVAAQKKAEQARPE